MGRRGMLLLAAATLFGFGGAGLVIIRWVQDREVPWSTGMALFPQLLVGIAAGVLSLTAHLQTVSGVQQSNQPCD